MSHDHKFSIYCAAFNVNSPSCNFDHKTAVKNFTDFADEVVCATFPCGDGSHESLKDLEKIYSNFKVIVTDVNPSQTNRWDGNLKTAALQATTNPIKIIADFDEVFPLSNRDKWDKAAELLMRESFDGIDGFFIPSIDCWGDPQKIRLSTQIGQKFRIHKDTIKSRGVVPWAELGNGLFDATKSDGTEPLDEKGDLGKFAQLVDPRFLQPIFSSYLKNFPYVLHNGYVSLEARIKLNRAFWKDTWASYSGHEENVATEIEELAKEPTIEHRLPLE